MTRIALKRVLLLAPLNGTEDISLNMECSQFASFNPTVLT